MTDRPTYEELAAENKRLFEELKRKKMKLMQAFRELENKNHELAQSHNDLFESINYAHRIQEAIMPSEYHIKSLLPDSFFFYKPRDVVSGDFYFVEKVEEEVIIAAVDATGHGVPGALLSVVGFSFINQAVVEKRLTKPSEILQYLDVGVNDTLRQTANESGVYDGMDLSLCTLNLKKRRIQFAGAYNPLYIATRREPPSSDGSITVHRSMNTDYLLWEVKADRIPIGMNLDGISDVYTNHCISLEPGDTFYLFSDGYPDQFGGPEERKFMYRRFRELILNFQGENMTDQHRILQQNIEQWRGNLDQIDDILVVGVRV